jgi:hypothetical protein
MTLEDVCFRLARPEDAETIFKITKASIDGLSEAASCRMNLNFERASKVMVA